MKTYDNVIKLDEHSTCNYSFFKSVVSGYRVNFVMFIGPTTTYSSSFRVSSRSDIPDFLRRIYSKVLDTIMCV